MSANGTALVVDDSAVNRLVLVRRLETLGLEVMQAENGLQALDALSAEPGRVDVVLLDVLMPELDGYETLAAMKADDDTRHIPVLIVSGVEELDSVVRCIELGASDYLTEADQSVDPGGAHQRLAGGEAPARPGAGVVERQAG